MEGYLFDSVSLMLSDVLIVIKNMISTKKNMPRMKKYIDVFFHAGHVFYQ